MSRAVVALALQTGIAPSVWAAEDGRTIATAWDLLDEAHDKAKNGRG